MDKPCIHIYHMYPDLLNLYGDGGNVTCLKARLEWRGIEAKVSEVKFGDEINLENADIVFIGGGPDREQRLASQEIHNASEQISKYASDNGVLLAICGGYQILGKTWFLDDEDLPGLGILDIETKRPLPGAPRLIGNIALNSEISTLPVIGYENHAGRTFLGEHVKPFGRVIKGVGKGNNDDSCADGVLYKNVIGTYLHGPLLGKNPEIADWLLLRALQRRCEKMEISKCILEALDDHVEIQANNYMAQRLGVN